MTEATTTEKTAEERLSFQAEVAKLLDLVVHSLYSNTEIFLRELISNASDACDKLRYAAIADPKLLEDGGSTFEIHLGIDKIAKTITVSDNGIGMNRDELVANLGTIAKSGTAEFLKALSGDKTKDVSLIGQFGVGFYSSFMVADKVEVFSRKAGDSKGWHWTSEGAGTFTVGEADGVARGAKIVLHLKTDAEDFLDPFRIKRIVKTYSDHIAVPVILDAVEGDKDPKAETVNAASALWIRPKSEITADQYKEFYHHVGHGFDDPWHTLHFKAEGAIEYTALLFVPSSKPFDLFNPDRKSSVKLYVNRVFISDQLEGLMPRYLRFVRGIVDSSDLPLNVSREILQDNPLLRKIQSGIVKRLLKDLKERAEKPEEYAKFWNEFGAVLKEGLYEDFERRDELLELARFKTSAADDWVTLKDYVGRMKEGQDAIYYITGDDARTLKNSPQLEGFAARGVEVLLLTDPIDEFWTGGGLAYDKKQFKAVTQSGEDLAKIKGDKPEEEKNDEEKGTAAEQAVKDVVEKLKKTLGDAVADVRSTDRLTGSPVVMASDTGGMSLHLARMLKQHGEAAGAGIKKILEINPKHALIKRLMTLSGAPFDDAAFLLLDQARIVEGEPVADPAGFAKRLSAMLEKALK
jgi:molecular chaperone HtpG